MLSTFCQFFNNYGSAHYKSFTQLSRWFNADFNSRWKVLWLPSSEATKRATRPRRSEATASGPRESRGVATSSWRRPASSRSSDWPVSNLTSNATVKLCWLIFLKIWKTWVRMTQWIWLRIIFLCFFRFWEEKMAIFRKLETNVCEQFWMTAFNLIYFLPPKIGNPALFRSVWYKWSHVPQMLARPGVPRPSFLVKVSWQLMIPMMSNPGNTPYRHNG